MIISKKNLTSRSSEQPNLQRETIPKYDVLEETAENSSKKSRAS